MTRWQEYGHNRLYVNEQGDRRSLGYYDCKSGKLQLEPQHEGRAYEIVDLLWSFLAGLIPDSVHELAHESLSPHASDLPRHRAHDPRASHMSEPRPEDYKSLKSRLLRQRTAPTPRQEGSRPKDERVVSKRLDVLKRDGWQTLSTVVKRSGTDIDHLAIGPPGVFTINTAGSHDDVHQAYLQSRLKAADAVARILTNATGLTVKVTPVLVFVGTASNSAVASHADVLMTHAELIDQTLLDLPAVYSIQERAGIYAVARRAETWLA